MKQTIIGIREAARRLNIHTTVLYRRMKKHGVKPVVRVVKTHGLSTGDLKKLVK